MTQLSLFKNEPTDSRPRNETLCEWQTTIEDRDEEYRSLFYHITVQCWETLVTRKVERKKKTLPGYAVEVFSSLRTHPESPAEELTHYSKDFLQAEKKLAIREYSWCVAQVHRRWRTTATSRVRVLQAAGDPGEYYECPFCGYMSLEFFETCIGCGKRFMCLNK